MEEIKEFPDCFPHEIVDEILLEGKNKEIEVYRICKKGKINREAFMSSLEEAILKRGNPKLNLQNKKSNNSNNDKLKEYSTSCSLTKEFLEVMLDTYMRKKEPQAIISKGVTSPDCGPSQITYERTGEESPHVDWWIYKNTNPQLFFKEVENDEN